MSSPSAISVVIPNYNGEQLLSDNLPSIIAALERWGGEYELIVVDDCSADQSCELIRARFPQVNLLVNSTNLGFSKTCNRGMAMVTHPIAFCINNDVHADVDFIAPVLKHFADPTIFAVTPNILVEREGKNQGIVSALYGKGFLKGAFAELGEKSGERENLYAIGACVAYDMAKFKALSGYSEIYTPYLFEDVDLSYRAWKRGWRSIYEPGGTVYHHSSATISRTKKRVKRTVYFKNRFIFHWINLTDTDFITRNMLHTLLRLLVSFIWLDFSYYSSFFGALGQVGKVLELRREVLSHLSLGDREIVQRTRRVAP